MPPQRSCRCTASPPRCLTALGPKPSPELHEDSMPTPIPIKSDTERLSAERTMVLLVDDQALVAEAVRRMLAAEAGIDFHYCADPSAAVELATQIRPTVILQDL